MIILVPPSAVSFFFFVASAFFFLLFFFSLNFATLSNLVTGDSPVHSVHMLKWRNLLWNPDYLQLRLPQWVVWTDLRPSWVIPLCLSFLLLLFVSFLKAPAPYHFICALQRCFVEVPSTWMPRIFVCPALWTRPAAKAVWVSQTAIATAQDIIPPCWPISVYVSGGMYEGKKSCLNAAALYFSVPGKFLLGLHVQHLLAVPGAIDQSCRQH